MSLKKTIEEKIKKVSEAFDGFTAQLNEKKEAIEAIQKEMNENPNVTASDEVKSGFSIMPTKYTFDRAGWTW